MKHHKSHFALLLALAVSLGVSLCSSQLDDYYLDIMLNVGINVILAVSLNLVNGHTGQFSLGHAAFMAVGAYGSSMVTLEMGASMMRVLGGAGPVAESVTFLVALLVGGVSAAVCGWIVGMPSLRLRGKPATSIPTSVVVPPTSITAASFSPVKNAATRMELVGAEEIVKTGCRSANSAAIKVPSFWVR